MWTLISSLIMEAFSWSRRNGWIHVETTYTHACTQRRSASDEMLELGWSEALLNFRGRPASNERVTSRSAPLLVSLCRKQNTLQRTILAKLGTSVGDQRGQLIWQEWTSDSNLLLNVRESLFHSCDRVAFIKLKSSFSTESSYNLPIFPIWYCNAVQRIRPWPCLDGHAATPLRRRNKPHSSTSCLSCR